ncbi:MAG: S41 family peptidase [Gudongella sp.]|jgi:carboxyl-terminal processing protease|nr:S41 family peptidase [Gudongella sp.]
MYKKRIILLFVALLLLTNAFSFLLGNVITIQAGGKVLIPKGEYTVLSKLYQDNEKLVTVRRALDDMYLREIDDDALREGQIKGMVAALNDPYSVYMSKKEYEDFNLETEGEYGGIGIMVTPGDDNLITVVSPIEDTPGERAGIKTGDKIISVDGEDYFAENMDEAVSKMRGVPNTDVTITIFRKLEGSSETFDVTLTRELIKLISVKSAIVDNDIGYIRITSFDVPTYDDFKTHLKALQSSDIKGLIIDLRNNPGGLMNVSTDIADELLGKATIVYTEDKYGRKDYIYSNAAMVDLPLAILINGGSASASEILAGAIQDNSRGLLIGTTSFGKGVVQRLKPLSDGSGIKVTVSEYFTPSDKNIHGIGIEPDVVVELNEDAEGIGPDYFDEDNQLQTAVEELRK